MKETWESIAKTLRKRGWNHHVINWLSPSNEDSTYWQVVVHQCNEKAHLHTSVGAERATLLAAYQAVLKETERERSV